MLSKTRDHQPVYLFLLMALLLVIGVALGSKPAIAAQAGPGGANSLLSPQAAVLPDVGREVAYAPFACAALGGYASSLEQPNFCVYYNDPPTPDSDATLLQGYVNDYWARYDVDYGFMAPHFTPPQLEVRISNHAGCNGSAWDNYIDLYDGCFSATMPEIMQYVTGHELFHRVQFEHDPDWAATWTNSAWIYEGTARNMEDVAFANVDTWTDCLSAPFSYCDEVNDYLSSTQNDITSWGMRYESNLFWTFFREQYGTVATEPQIGVDALVELWEQMATAESITAVNHALAVLAPGTTFDEAFRRFTVAIWTKDLTGVPDGSYNFADEDQPGNPATYGPVVPANGGTINTTTSANWAGQSISRYAARYYAATPSATDCPVITANFHRTGGSSTFYHIVTQNGTAFKNHIEGSGADWTQSFLNDSITKIVAIVGGQSNSSTVNVTLSCADPVINIEQPDQLAPEYVGLFSSPRNMVVQVAITNGSGGPVVAGLSYFDFKAEVGGVPAFILGGGFVQEEYFLLVDTPIQAANGPYDLEVFLEAPGTATVIASDLETDAVSYDATHTDHVIITDLSGSMGWGTYPKLPAAMNAADLFIDATSSSDGLGLVAYNHDVVSTLGVESALPPHRTDAHDQVAGYNDSGATSIGDGLGEAVDLRAASVTGNTRCQFTLLSDGMENTPDYWADVQAAVIATGCPVTAIAFGPDSNELLMQNIATATGGVSYYNDVYISAEATASMSPQATSPDSMELQLGDNYLYSLCEGQGCERLFAEDGTITDSDRVTHTMSVDDSVFDLTVVLDWRPISLRILDFSLALVSPSGQLYETSAFSSTMAGYMGYRVANPEAGEWQLVVQSLYYKPPRDYQLIAYGQTPVSVNLLLPDMKGFATGSSVPFFAIWKPGGSVMATITAPDGSSHIVPFSDDGQHGDGLPGDGFFAGMYTLATQSIEMPPAVEPGAVITPTAVDEGAYRVHLLAQFEDMRRETQGSFAVPAGADSDGDNLPDDYVDATCPNGPDSDDDLDRASCIDEYYYGTDPNNSDSDGGGESDFSEADLNGQDPLAPADDLIEAPDFVQTTAQNGSVLLSYDVKAAYDSMIAYRATAPAGPWVPFSSDLPLTGTYTDTTVVNDTTYYYCLQAIDTATTPEHQSAVVCSEAVMPRLDPIPPEAAVLINGGAISTTTASVTLSFIPNEAGPAAGPSGAQDAFDDITEVMISNDPAFAGATWQPFTETMSWTLLLGNGPRTVYVRFKDAHDNLSVSVETATITLIQQIIYLPVTVR